MLHEERILKHKFAYFFAIIFVLCWMIYYGSVVFSILFKNYGITEQYKAIQIPVFLLIFGTFILLVVTFVNIFKESRKTFIYLNISVALICLLWSVNFFKTYHEGMNAYLCSFLFFIVFLVAGPSLLIRYFKHHTAKDEIENIGKHED